MPRSRITNAERATTLLNEAQSDRVDSAHAAVLRQEATILAVLAVAEELSLVRDEVAAAADALKDQNGFGAGIHLSHAADWLERIAKR